MTRTTRTLSTKTRTADAAAASVRVMIMMRRKEGRMDRKLHSDEKRKKEELAYERARSAPQEEEEEH